MSGSIWLIESYDGDRAMDSYEYDLERGYFETEQDAKNYIVLLEQEMRPAYDRYVEQVQERNAESEHRRLERQRRNQVLKDAGFEVEKHIGDSMSFVETPRTFESWRRTQVTYEAVEVKLAVVG